jgi:hypothetical protein
MDFKDILANLKDVISPDVLAFFAIIYFAFNKFFKAIAKLFGFKNEWEDMKKIKIDVEKVIDITNKTKQEVHEIKNDVNAYKKRTHKIENENIVLQKILEQNIALMEKINNKL